MKLTDALRDQIREFRANFDGHCRIIWCDGAKAVALITPDPWFTPVAEGNDWGRVTEPMLIGFDPAAPRKSDQAKRSPELSIVQGGLPPEVLN